MPDKETQVFCPSCEKFMPQKDIPKHIKETGHKSYETVKGGPKA